MFLLSLCVGHWRVGQGLVVWYTAHRQHRRQDRYVKFEEPLPYRKRNCVTPLTACAAVAYWCFDNTHMQAISICYISAYARCS
jgi:hypothetical protein